MLPPKKRMPQKRYLVKKLLANFTKPGVLKIRINKESVYNIIVIVDETNSSHIIDNLIELEETVSKNQKVKFTYICEDIDIGEVIWGDNIERQL